MYRSRWPFRHVVGLFLLAVTAQSAFCVEDDYPALDAEEAYEQSARLQVENYRNVVERFDKRLERFPYDVVSAVQKCQFLGTIAHEYLVEDQTDSIFDLDACETGLDRFGDHPEVLLYFLEGRYDDNVLSEGLELADSESFSQWTERQRSRLYWVIAQAYMRLEPQDHWKRATYAYAAHRLYESPQTQVWAAHYAISVGKQEEARQILGLVFDEARNLNEYIVAWAALGDDDRVDELLTELKTSEEYYYSPDYLAGRLREASQEDLAYSILQDSESASAKQELFELALTREDESEAIVRYEQMRDLGYYEDPLLYHRARLAWQYPSAPWQTRDALGALTILGTILLIAMVPLFWVLPVHYRGLLRQRAGSVSPWAQWGKSNLRDVWLLCALALIFEFVLTLVIWYPSIAEFWSDDVANEPSLQQIARYSLGYGMGLFLLSLLFSFRTFSGDRTTRAPLLRSIGLCLLSNVVLIIAFRVWRYFFGIDLSQLDAIVDSQSQMLTAINFEYGLFGLFLVMCVFAPIGEEIIFRGVLLKGMAKHVSFGAANTIQAAMFAALHDLRMFPVFLAFGLVAGWLHRRTGRLLIPMLMHFVHNGLVFLTVAYHLSKLG